MFPSFLCSKKPDWPDDTVFPASTQVMADFSPITLVPLRLKTELLSSLLLIAIFCEFSPFSSLNAPDLNLQSSDITHYPFLLLLSFSSTATSLHFVMNVIFWFSLILNTAPFLILVNFNILVDYLSKYAGFLMTWASFPKILSSTLLKPCQH